jgi:hypothetical protein
VVTADQMRVLFAEGRHPLAGTSGRGASGHNPGAACPYQKAGAQSQQSARVSHQHRSAHGQLRPCRHPGPRVASKPCSAKPDWPHVFVSSCTCS